MSFPGASSNPPRRTRRRANRPARGGVLALEHQGHDMHSNPVDVCIIEDDAQQRALLFRRLLDAQFTVVEAEDAEAGLAQIRHHRPRVVICDLDLPGMNGTELCRQVRSDTTLDGTYLILISACPDRDTKHQALNSGADDYLVKPYDSEEFTARLRNGLRINKLQERLRQAAFTDGLTGLWNHTQFRELLDRAHAPLWRRRFSAHARPRPLQGRERYVWP
jgi:PleD family two-component response regulator